MAIVTHSIVVSQSGGDLNLANGTTHSLVRWEKPQLEYRRNEVTGRYQAGSRLVNAVPETTVLYATFRCMGATWAAVDTAVASMYAALGQFDYTVTATFAGVAETFADCQPATIRPVNVRSLSGEIAACMADFDVEIRCTPNVA